jgi:hypothetical protein
MEVQALTVKIREEGARQVERALSGVSSSLDDAAKTAKAAGAAFSAMAVGAMALVIKNTTEQERVVAQLETALRSTGGAAGLTSRQLQAMAAEMQKVSTYGDEAVIGMQSLLLTFTAIKADNFERASRAIADLATRMGSDLKSAALQVGKALNDPVLGASALAEAGIQFTKVQKEMIAAMVAAGDAAGAQRVILKELEVQFGGSAAAARDTLGGAMLALRNSLGDLFEVTAITRPITAALNKVNDNLLTVAESAAFAGAALAVALYGPAVLAGLSAALAAVNALTAGVGLLTVATNGLKATLAFLASPAGALALVVAAVGYVTVQVRAMNREFYETAKNAQAQFGKALSDIPKTELPSLLESLSADIARVQKQINAVEWRPKLAGSADDLRRRLTTLQERAAMVAAAMRDVGNASGAAQTLSDIKNEATSAAAAVKDLGETFKAPEMGAGFVALQEMQRTQREALARTAARSAPLAPTPITLPTFTLDAEAARKLEEDLRRMQEELAPLLQFGESIGTSLVDSIAAGIERAAESGRLSDGFRAMAATLLSGLGSAMITFGKSSAAFAGLMAKIRLAFETLNPAAGLAASLAMIGLGAALKGAASGMFGGRSGGGGGGGGLAFAGAGAGASNSFREFRVGDTATATAAGMGPMNPVSVTVIGPNDPVAQRQILTLIRNGERR